MARKNTFTTFFQDIVDDTKDFVDDLLDRAKDAETDVRDAVRDTAADDEGDKGEMEALRSTLNELKTKVDELSKQSRAGSRS